MAVGFQLVEIHQFIAEHEDFRMSGLRLKTLTSKRAVPLPDTIRFGASELDGIHN